MTPEGRAFKGRTRVKSAGERTLSVCARMSAACRVTVGGTVT